MAKILRNILILLILIAFVILAFMYNALDEIDRIRYADSFILHANNLQKLFTC